MSRCRDNLNAGMNPFIITTDRGMGGAESLASEEGMLDRIEIFEISRFVATNMTELSGFSTERRPVAVRDLFERYNRVIDDCETDTSRKVKVS